MQQQPPTPPSDDADIQLSGPPMSQESALKLLRIGNVLRNSANILEQLYQDARIGRPSVWRREARIALSHAAQAQAELARWLSDEDDHEAAAMQARDSWR